MTKKMSYDEFVTLPDEHLLGPAEVASVFKVDPKTVTRWAATGKLTAIRTPGGHRRFRKRAVIEAMQDAEQQAATDPAAAVGIVKAARREGVGR